jgi:hypothetical protein
MTGQVICQLHRLPEEKAVSLNEVPNTLSGLTKKRRCWREKLVVPLRWSIRRPGVQIKISTLLDPPESLAQASVQIRRHGVKLRAYFVDLSVTNCDCSWTNECCPVAVPIWMQIRGKLMIGIKRRQVNLQTPSFCYCF